MWLVTVELPLACFGLDTCRGLLPEGEPLHEDQGQMKSGPARLSAKRRNWWSTQGAPLRSMVRMRRGDQARPLTRRP
jgi:hypothetical protein